MKKILRDNKGSISALVVISVLLYSIVLTTAFMKASGKRRIQIQSQILAKETYEKQLDNLDEIRDEINGGSSGYVKKNTEVTYPDGKVWIPEGFRISKDSASTVQGGVVIEDKDGNQFVWVPVATLADYKRTAYSRQVATEETDTATNSIKINYNSSNSSYFTEALPEDEKASVERYKGFYIGRYEAGDKENTEAKKLRSSNDVTKTVTIKANQAPYNNVTRTQAISLAEGFATKQGYKAKTKLVSSYAWDTTIEFLQKVNSDYGNSSEEGNYTDTTFSYTDITGASKTKKKNSSVLIPTGQTTPVCNIYDMGGNVVEWTTEFYSHTYYTCAYRGGSCDRRFDSDPAGYRMYNSDYGGDYNGFRIALFLTEVPEVATAETAPYFPDNTFTKKEGTIDTGLVIQDASGNEYVWVVVPKSLYNNTVYNLNNAKKPSSSTDYANIEYCLQQYTATYKIDGWSDTHAGDTANVGWLTSDEYTELKNSMLKSVYENGGFYVGRYEAGIDTTTGTNRTSEGPTNSDGKYTIEGMPTPVTKADAYPYTYVTRTQAQNLARNVNSGTKTSSLMFGVQWDLVLAFMSKDTAKIISTDDLTSNSTKIGNYSNATFQLSQTGKYATSSYGTLSSTWNPSTTATTNFVDSSRNKLAESGGNGILVTTGTSEKNKVMNIYDIAGNVCEWTLELTSYTGIPCAVRGGDYFGVGSSGPAALRGFEDADRSDLRFGFRVSLF